ncbi:hypothetical protein GCM10012280_02140 [Wenjunlia tyrosinilytica]|uniref:Uncharacterized protein n=1 Tax=Wenjunlia tyrosinilytica TaxID=1544741 RepID=A0A917ZED9_9ACTN|nr:hypothetical protein GCM10012280_02140 [Wenjunlia tyrosinilytica]
MAVAAVQSLRVHVRRIVGCLSGVRGVRVEDVRMEEERWEEVRGRRCRWRRCGVGRAYHGRAALRHLIHVVI